MLTIDMMMMMIDDHSYLARYRCARFDEMHKIIMVLVDPSNVSIYHKVVILFHHVLN